jgi:hypothetical protein
MRARLILRVLSAGITDRAGNTLDGESRGVAPSGDGVAGGDCIARLKDYGRRTFPPRG